jgi:hypothetical protein
MAFEGSRRCQLKRKINTCEMRSALGLAPDAPMTSITLQFVISQRVPERALNDTGQAIEQWRRCMHPIFFRSLSMPGGPRGCADTSGRRRPHTDAGHQPPMTTFARKKPPEDGLLSEEQQPEGPVS